MADTASHANHARLARKFKKTAAALVLFGNHDLAESQMVMAQWHATMAVYELMREQTSG